MAGGSSFTPDLSKIGLEIARYSAVASLRVLRFCSTTPETWLNLRQIWAQILPTYF